MWDFGNVVQKILKRNHVTASFLKTPSIFLSISVYRFSIFQLISLIKFTRVISFSPIYTINVILYFSNTVIRMVSFASQISYFSSLFCKGLFGYINCHNKYEYNFWSFTRRHNGLISFHLCS